MKPNAFLDLDGPILDVSGRHYRIYADYVRRFGGVPDTVERFWAAKRLKTSDSRILADCGMESHAARYAAEKLTLIESPEYLAHDRLQAGTSSILPLIAARYQIVIVTLRHSRRNLLGQLEALGIAGGFTAVLSDPAAGRQGWETKRDLVGAAGIPTTSDDFFAGDTETDILAGRALGVRTVAVCNGIRDEAHLRGLAPDLILPSLIDLNTTQLLT